jgi:hypothetical protein
LPKEEENSAEIEPEENVAAVGLCDAAVSASTVTFEGVRILEYTGWDNCANDRFHLY